METIDVINKANSIWEVLLQFTADELEKAIALSAEYYYNTDTPLVTDEYYDIMVDRLQALKPSSSVLKKIGAIIRGKKTELPYWMGSMDKIKSDDVQIERWTRRLKGPYVISDKLDGVSCLLTRTRGIYSMYTRGDGTIGQNITHLIPLVNMVPKSSLERLDIKGNFAIRGELIMTIENFKSYSKIMSNARNMVSGIVNSKSESVNKSYARKVDFIAYEIIDPQAKPSEQFNMLEEWGFSISHWDIYRHIDNTILDRILQKRKKRSAYEIDGIIITDDHKHTRNTSGNPEYSFAYKGTSPSADVRVKEVIWTPSKDGVMVPRINFEKVRLSQADLQYTAGFNAKYINDNKIGPGAIISVIRSGDVIPYIINIVKPSKPALPDPKEEAYHWDKNKVNIVLDDPDSNDVVNIKRLTKFARDLGMENLSEGIITRLYNAGYNTVMKLINLDVDDLLEIDGFQDRLANKIYDAIHDSLENVDIATLATASNAFGKGFAGKKLKKILKAYPNIFDVYTPTNRKRWEARINALDGFNKITTSQFLDRISMFQRFYKRISKEIKIKPFAVPVKSKGRFKDQKIVFTGFRNADWQKLIENEGGEVSSGVSKNTTLVVYRKGQEGTGKFEKAKKLGVKMITEEEFGKSMKR